ncbi:MAG: hypothetical protein ABIP79_16705 [Chitinophagaceae bacterium]
MDKPNNKSKTLETAKDTKDNILPQKATKGKTASQLMHKHISDEKDVITDEDFKNMDINPDIDTGTSHTPEIPDDNDRPKDMDKDHAIVTPWDVIDQ